MPRFGNADGSFFLDQPMTIIQGGTAATLTVNLPWSVRDLFINNTSTLTTTANIQLPKRVQFGDVVSIASVANLGTVSVKDGFGNAITGSPTSLTAGAAVQMRYVNKTIGWVKWK